MIDDREWLTGLIERARREDGQPPFSDGSLVALASGERRLIRIEDAAAIVAPGEAEFVVEPLARRHGIGRDLLHELLVAAPGDLLLWSHGDHPGARALARTFGLEPVRTLLQLRADVGGPVSIRPTAYSTGATVSAASGDWRDEWVALNARVFAEHPEQGAVTRADLDELASEPWFDENDVLLAREVDDLVGYCWLKVEHGIGEFYVVGVAPQWQGRGLGRQLVSAGLARLAERGIQQAHLYVEGDNAAALRLYRSFGFGEHSVDIQYRWRSEPDDPVIASRS